jgi:hypothetical protein
VLRELPPDTVEGLPRRLRNPRGMLVLSLLAAAMAAVLIVVLASRTEKGTTGNVTPRGSGELSAVKLSGGAADDYDPPPGDGSEHPDEVRNVIDESRATEWATEQYRGGLGEGAAKQGVGLRIDTGKPVALRRLDLISRKPGWEAVVYAANDVPPSIEGWQKVSGRVIALERTEVQLDTARQGFRNYLIWIVKLPPDGRAAISELTLLR